MKVAVVTGGNKGIGFAIARGLCEKFDGTVYLTARDETRGLKAIEELKKNGLNPKFHQLDIDNLESIQRFRDYIKEKYGGLDVLVNNAAIAYKNAATEPFGEQAENTVRVNYFGVLETCKALFPLLRPRARVVNLSSSAGHLLRIPGENLRKKFVDPNLTEEQLSELMKEFVESAKKNTHSEEGWGNSAYVVSKVGVTALTFIQQRKFDCDERPDLVVNAVHPGYVDTDMTSHKGPLTIEEGAVAPLHCALLPPGVKSPRGKYIWCDKKEVDWISGPVPSQC
ncbi:carbonyl reductase [NADPH] 1-like [Schistocerca americana]|uniref:carbonyl reductase [NADPH] 1-like n=1 Tax=Schistocerca americana TaxID=7009 RepID=UPI001F5041DE|nr:carbonyl reductase [NADPH] 1-like [Schistocerca americana]XP_047114760.1 carbonyl reductase [NADPH] 1-like [Schistocerca piceifrons]XP_049949884.1 carbonyl reductase [NADPH] 1-like [Schistocerca serialis cubense]